MLMAYTHVAHDCILGDHVIVSNAVNMAGHVEIGDWAIVGGVTPIHQFVRIGEHAFVGGGSRIPQDVPPYCRAAGNPPKLYGLNSVGLERRGFSVEVRKALKEGVPHGPGARPHGHQGGGAGSLRSRRRAGGASLPRLHRGVGEGDHDVSRLRFGVVGTGSLGFHHARILRDVDGVEMVGFHDDRPERRTEVASELGVEGHETLEALLDRTDAVVIAVPTTAHEEVALAALERGIHVLIEKPMAPSVEAADRILAAAESGGAVVQVGHVERFNQAIRAAEPYLDRPLFIESHRMAPFTPRGTDVAVVLDLMIHDVDLVQGLVGAPIRDVAASGLPVLTPNIDIANARVAFENGAVANLTASRVSLERMRKLRIFQPSGYLSLDLAAGTGEFLRLRQELPALSENAFGAEALARFTDGGLQALIERIPLQGDGAEPLRKELESFRDAVLGLHPPVVSGVEGREALAVTVTIEDRIHRHVADTRSA